MASSHGARASSWDGGERSSDSASDAAQYRPRDRQGRHDGGPDDGAHDVRRGDPGGAVRAGEQLLLRPGRAVVRSRHPQRSRSQGPVVLVREPRSTEDGEPDHALDERRSHGADDRDDVASHPDACSSLDHRCGGPPRSHQPSVGADDGRLHSRHCRVRLPVRAKSATDVPLGSGETGSAEHGPPGEPRRRPRRQGVCPRAARGRTIREGERRPDGPEHPDHAADRGSAPINDVADEPRCRRRDLDRRCHDPRRWDDRRAGRRVDQLPDVRHVPADDACEHARPDRGGERVGRSHPRGSRGRGRRRREAGRPSAGRADRPHGPSTNPRVASHSRTSPSPTAATGPSRSSAVSTLSPNRGRRSRSSVQPGQGSRRSST